MTIVKSKLFQPTEKYLLNPSAVILTIASRIKNNAKILLSKSKTAEYYSLISS